MEKNKRPIASNARKRRGLGRRQCLARTALLGAVSAVGQLPRAAASAQTKGTSTAAQILICGEPRHDDWADPEQSFQ
jgi:hypothetical protein